MEKSKNGEMEQVNYINVFIFIHYNNEQALLLSYKQIFTISMLNEIYDYTHHRPFIFYVNTKEFMNYFTYSNICDPWYEAYEGLKTKIKRNNRIF